MLSLIWIPITVGAAAAQVARNAAQRMMLPVAGPWAATLVRFAFGIPFSIVFAAFAWALTPDARPHVSAGWWGSPPWAWRL